MKNISIIGMGYVGLPLALEFSKHFNVIGFDIDNKKINRLIQNIDTTGEVSKDILKKNNVFFTSEKKYLERSNFYIVTVPTPLYKNKRPDLRLLIKACKLISKFLKKNDIVIFESTVYPGVTEDICVPALKQSNNLIYNKDFFCGYSPERINPGDKHRTITNIKKITSGSNKKITNIVDRLYKKIIKAGTYKVSSIKIAETAKVIENCQRDINIAFMNDISIILNKMNIDMFEVLNAAKTKWNFLDFKPGFVGGHCVAIDPYYLYYKGLQVGHNSRIISYSREINDNMPKHISKDILKKLKNKTNDILIMGVTFKENCNDTRNSLVPNLYKYLSKNNRVVVYDPVVKDQFFKSNKIKYIKDFNKQKYDSIILAVPHIKIMKLGLKKIKSMLKNQSFIYDIKGVLKKNKNIENF